jgi:hypothetical protein
MIERFRLDWALAKLHYTIGKLCGVTVPNRYFWLGVVVRDTVLPAIIGFLALKQVVAWL